MINNIQQLLEAKAAQINNKSHSQVYGIAAQYQSELSICKFKLAVWFNKNKQGQPYTAYDIQRNKNIGRKYIPSIDTTNGIGGSRITNHELAHSTLINYLLQNISNIDNAMLIVNDYVNDLELTIFMYKRNVPLVSSPYIQPIWKQLEDGSIIYNGLDGNAVRTDKMRYHEQ